MTLGSNPNYTVNKVAGDADGEQGGGDGDGATRRARFYGAANPALTAVVTGQVAGGDAVDYSLATTADRCAASGLTRSR